MIRRADVVQAIASKINGILGTDIKASTPAELAKALAVNATKVAYGNVVVNFVLNLSKPGSSTMKALMRNLNPEGRGKINGFIKEVEGALMKTVNEPQFRRIRELRAVEDVLERLTGETGKFRNSPNLGALKQRLVSHFNTGKHGVGAEGKLLNAMREARVGAGGSTERAIRGFLNGLDQQRARVMARSNEMKLVDKLILEGKSVREQVNAMGVRAVVGKLLAEQKVRRVLLAGLAKEMERAGDGAVFKIYVNRHQALRRVYAETEEAVRVVARELTRVKVNKGSEKYGLSPVAKLPIYSQRASVEDRLSVEFVGNRKIAAKLQRLKQLEEGRVYELRRIMGEMHLIVKQHRGSKEGAEVVREVRARIRELQGEMTKAVDESKKLRVEIRRMLVEDQKGKSKLTVEKEQDYLRVGRSSAENAARARERANNTGAADQAWGWVLTSGKYRGKTVGYVYLNHQGYFMNAVDQDGRGGMWTLLTSRDRGKMWELVKNDRDVNQAYEEYWKDGEHLSPMDTKVGPGYSKRDGGMFSGDKKRMRFEKVKVDRKGEYANVWSESQNRWVMFRREEKSGRWMEYEEGSNVDMSPLRGSKSYDPEARDSLDRWEVRRELFGAAWQRAKEDYQRFAEWKETRRGGKKMWKRRNPMTGRWEFEGKRGNTDAWRLNEFYETQQSLREWEVKFERARELVKYRRGDGKEGNLKEVQEAMGQMGDVVELHVKDRKLKWMLEQGYLKGERALIGEKYEGMTREERDRERAILDGDVKEVGAGSVEDGRNRVRMGRDRVELGKDDVPIWMRVEEAKSEEELDRLQEEIYGEFGEVNVRRVEQVGDEGGYGIGRLMQEKRNVLRAAKSV